MILNKYKDRYIGNSKIVYSLGNLAIGNFTSWIDGWECGTKQTIYLRIAYEKPFSLYDSHTTHTEHGVYRVIGFGDNLEDAIAIVNRIHTGAPIYIRTSRMNICPHCGKTKVEHNFSKYTWTIHENVRSYLKLISRLCREDNLEVLICEPHIDNYYCQEHRQFDPEDDLPF